MHPIRAIRAALLVFVVLHLFVSFEPRTFAQGVPIQLGANTEYIGPHLWVILQRHADGGAVPDFVVVEIGYRTDLEISPPLEEFIESAGGQEVAEYTWRIPTENALSVIQRPDLLSMAQPPEATEGESDPYPTMDGTLNDIVAAYTGGIAEANAARYAMFVWEGSVVLEMASPDAATVGSIREWLTQQGVYVPHASDFAAFSDDFLVALVPVSLLTGLAEAFPATYLSVSAHAGQGLPLDRAHWTAETLEFEKSVTAQFLPPQQGQANPATALPPTVTPAPVSPTPTARYDSDGDGLIEVSNLEQLNAIRYDLDGDGIPDGMVVRGRVSGQYEYAAAYPVSGEEVVCNDCRGYELARPLDFATADSYLSGKTREEWTTGEGWPPIGDGWHPFAATFNGNGHAVSNLHIARTDVGTVDGFGLFGTVGESGVVRETGLLNANVAGGDYVGLLAGSNLGTVTHSYATGSVSGYGCIGGLVGSNDFGFISSSYATSSVSGGFTYLGGLAGCNNRGTIIASYATGSVFGDTRVGGLVGDNGGWVITSYATGSVRGQKYVGGLVGAHVDGQISASYSTSKVTGGHYVGGLVGGNESMVIYSYAVGKVSSDGSIDASQSYIGGLAGYNPGIIDTSIWDSESSGQQVGIGIEIGDGYSSNVLGKTTAELQSPEGFTGPYQEWDVTLGIEGWGNTPHYNLSDYWDFGTSNEYPALKIDFDGDGVASWEEFGNQRGNAPRSAPEPAVANCVEFMAAPVANGAWSSSCQSRSRPGSYARFYTFTLTEPSELIIDLESGDSDTYLYLLQGTGWAGQALASQGSSSRSSRIEHVLGAGTYTVEVTTYDSGQTGSFTLTVNRFATHPTPPPTPSLPPPPHTPAPVPTATLLPTPTPTLAPTSTPVSAEPTFVPTPTVTKTAGPTDTPTPAAKSTERGAPELASQPTPVPEPNGGGCSFSPNSSLGSAVVNMLLLLAPLGMVRVAIYYRKRRRQTPIMHRTSNTPRP